MTTYKSPVNKLSLQLRSVIKNIGRYIELQLPDFIHGATL